MAAKFQALKDEEIVRTIKAVAVEPGAGTFSESEIATQLSIERGVIWMIHKIHFHIEIGVKGLVNLVEVAANSHESIQVQVTREPKTAILTMDDPDLLQNHQVGIVRSADIGTDVGPLYAIFQYPIVYDYSPPLPYASQNIYLAVLGTDATAPITCYFKLFYTIRTVSDKYFFRVAQSLLG
jgi:hypothetical protein